MTGKGDSEDTEPLNSLLAFLKQSRGFDFTGYKRTSLARRIDKRMEAVGVGEYAEYEDYLEVHPEEFTDLFDTILINVTSFFRDQPAWDHLAGEIIPKLIEQAPERRPIRVWSAACASGEEAYTVAMLLAEALGEEEFRRRVKIYATDVDNDALTTARHAVYSSDALKSVPAELRDRYFEENSRGHGFRADLRRSMIFGRNDLVQDAPISRIDLLVSRNALMYFTPETQARILGHFNFSLNQTGYLFLGRSEMLITHSELFKPLSLKWRVFTKVPRPGLRDRLAFVNQIARAGDEEVSQRYPQLRDAAADSGPAAQVLIDRSGLIAAINEPARLLFGVGPSDVGRPLQDLELSYRPIELRAALARAADDQRAVELGRVGWDGPGGAIRTLEVQVSPLLAGDGRSLGASVTFVDVTRLARLDDDHAKATRELETAYEELQSTVEELETTNEELQSTNEELETTNEELQSSNEELETMNEELQSTNDELEAMNEEQNERSLELDRVNMFLEGIVGNLGVAVVVLDGQQRVQLWNDSAFDLWGLRADEVENQNFLSLDMGLPVEPLREAVSAALADPPKASDVVVEALTRRGRKVACSVRALPLSAADGGLYGVILLMTDSSGGPAAQPTSA